MYLTKYILSFVLQLQLQVKAAIPSKLRDCSSSNL